MKKFLLIAGIVVLLLAAFVLHTFLSTGYFRKITDSPLPQGAEKIYLPGVEDIAISYEDKFLVLSSDDRASRRDAIRAGKQPSQQGGLYFVDLTRTPYEPILLTGNIGREFNPHGISLLRLDSGRYKLWVINHVAGQHSIETFYLYGDSLVADQVITSSELISPNDITAVSEHTFYVTNDHGTTSKLGRLAEDYLGVAKANVVYYDGATFRTVASSIAYANGINSSNDRQYMYVAASRSFKVHVYSIETNGDLKHVQDIDAGTGVDNIEVDQQDNLWIGCHPNLLTFAAYAGGKKEYSPSEVIRIAPQNGAYVTQSLYVENGQGVSAASVAIPFEGKVFIGNVMDKHVLVIGIDEAGQ